MHNHDYDTEDKLISQQGMQGQHAQHARTDLNRLRSQVNVPVGPCLCTAGRASSPCYIMTMMGRRLKVMHVLQISLFIRSGCCEVHGTACTAHLIAGPAGQ